VFVTQVRVATPAAVVDSRAVKKSVDFDFDDHPGDDERPRTAWVISVADDCDGCEDLRVEMSFEEEGRPGTGVSAHLAPATARRLRASLAAALREIGEDPGA
jgi:hypothetical protein